MSLWYLIVEARVLGGALRFEIKVNLPPVRKLFETGHQRSDDTVLRLLHR